MGVNMSNGEDLTEEQWFDMIILITDQNGQSIDRGQLQDVTGLSDNDLNDYVGTLHARGKVTYAHGSQTGRIEDISGNWLHIRLTEAGIQRAREFDEE